MTPNCFVCFVIATYGPEKLKDRDFIVERAFEFFPEEEFGGLVDLCYPCYLDAMEIEKNMKAENK